MFGPGVLAMIQKSSEHKVPASSDTLSRSVYISRLLVSWQVEMPIQGRAAWNTKALPLITPVDE